MKKVETEVKDSVTTEGFNHDASSTAEACGLEKGELAKKYDTFLNTLHGKPIGKPSKLVEKITKTFTPREVAYFWVFSILKEQGF